ncbi:hypothetical protein [Caenimonas aquaedulcis]|uniref:FdrA domain protein n=1 Tax=Caenimonas aquaedulcis TaxID=2793270 RepID=A0A931H7J5_9BURK|nr:hypothetical protein [Caenimonas aquaedulcis]MBG9390056.1 hypothetical protein [Caenimonas aquaedulcis]
MTTEGKLPDLLAGTPVFVNVGVRSFCDALGEAGYAVVQVEWSPPPADDPEIAALLDDLL